MDISSRKRIGELLLYGVFIVADAEGLWPESHFLAIFAFIIGTVGLSLYDGGFNNVQMSIITLASVAISLLALLLFPYPKTPDIEITGILQPGHDPTPPNGCDRTMPAGLPAIPSDALKILIGDNAFILNGMSKLTAIKVGICEVLSIERTPAGVSVGADLYDSDGKLVARIADGKLDVLTGDNVRSTRNGDLSNIIITDRGGNEMLFVRYLNSTTVQARGIFSCPGHKPVVVKDQQPIPGLIMRGMCAVGVRYGITVQ